MKPRWLLEATGAALLALLPYLSPLLFPGDISLYHHQLPVANLVFGLMLDFAAVAAVALLVIALVSRLPTLPRRIASACLMGLVLWRVAADAVALMGAWPSHPMLAGQVRKQGVLHRLASSWGQSAHPLALAAILIFAVLAWLRPGVIRPGVRATRLGLAALAFCALWILPELLYVAAGTGHSASFVRVSAPPHNQSGGRIVWILFDELSYNLTFDHPPPGQQFPNLEQLRSRSVSFAGIVPVGFYTDRVIPSLLSGQPIDQIRSTPSGDLFYLDTAQDRWQAYDAQASLFGLARARGWNPAVAGWYNPYCRIFASILSACSWRQEGLPIEGSGASEQKSGFLNAMVIPEIFVARFFPHWSPRLGRTSMLQAHIDDYRSVMNSAAALLRNQQLHFVFIHLPVPHPPGIYNRTTHKLCTCGDYLDNLTLADDALGTLLHLIGQTPSAADTTIVVSSDHSWRVPMWRPMEGWTPEEERLSHGVFDRRPVFLIHFFGQKRGQEISDQLPELIEHTILAAMLEDKLDGPDHLGSLLPASRQTTLLDPSLP